MVGSTINSYRITKVVGQSRTDVLLEATTASPTADANVPVLLQILNTSLPYERFARDMRWSRNAIKELAHPDLISIEGVEQLPDDQVLLRLKYVKGVTLQQHLQQMRESGGTYSEEQALTFVAHLARALSPALRRGMVHRALDPHHILVRPDGTPAILGLDVPAPLTNELLATAGDEFLAYRSPEQQQDLLLDGRSNIYSLGMLLHVMLSGEIAQESESQPIGAQPLSELRPDLSPATHRVVQKALQAESWARHQTYDELLGAMGMEAATMLPASQPQTSARNRRSARSAQRPRARSRATLLGSRQLLGAAALLLLLLAAGIVWSSGSLRATTRPETEVLEDDAGGDLTAPLLPRQQESPGATAPVATEPVENIAAGASATPTPSATTLPASPTPQPTTSEGSGSPPPPAATATPQATETSEPAPTLAPTATQEATSTTQPPPPPPPTATPQPTAPPQPTATLEPTSPPPPPPPPPAPTATPPPAPTAPPPPTATPPPPVPPSPTSETAPLPSPTATSPLANYIH